MTPKKVEYEVGRTIFGQRVLLVWERDYAGRLGWTVTREAVSHRDDTQSVAYLSDEIILAMAECVRNRAGDES